MALVYCTQCGQPVSEHAAACPHCGAPVRPLAKQATKTTAKLTDNNEVSRPAKHNNTPEHKGSINGLIAALITALVLLLVGGGWYFLHQQEQQRLAKQQAIEQARLDSIAQAEAAKQARRDSIAAAEAAEQARQDSIEALHQAIKEAYLIKVRSSYGTNVNDESNKYFLLDITEDGVPELWISKASTDENNLAQVFNGYAYKNGKLSQIHEDLYNPFYDDVLVGRNYIILVGGHMGSEWATKVSYHKGRVVEKSLFNNFHEDTSEEFEWCKLKESSAKWTPVTNDKPIQNMF